MIKDNDLTEFDKKKILLISKFHPFSIDQVINIYKRMNKSFDKTVHIIEQMQKQMKPSEDLD